jgi:hypothetical protein
MADTFDERLVRELRDHLEDSVAARMAGGAEREEAERLALADLGPLTAVEDAWKARCARRRRHNRRQLAAAVVAVTAASMLAVTQHAEGRHNPPPPCPRITASQQLLRDLC